MKSVTHASAMPDIPTIDYVAYRSFCWLPRHSHKRWGRTAVRPVPSQVDWRSIRRRAERVWWFVAGRCGAGSWELRRAGPAHWQVPSRGRERDSIAPVTSRSSHKCPPACCVTSTSTVINQLYRFLFFFLENAKVWFINGNRIYSLLFMYLHDCRHDTDIK